MWQKFNKAIFEFTQFFTTEIKLIFSDAGALLFFVVAMFVYSYLYTLAYERETVKDISVAVVDMDHSMTSRQYTRMVDATEQIQVTCKPNSLKEAENLFYDGSIHGVILIPKDFEMNIIKGLKTNVTVYCDASYFLLYKQVFGGATYTNGTFNAGIEIKKMLAEGKPIEQAYIMQEPIKTIVYNLYNPSGGYGSFVIPGIIIVVMQQLLLLGIGMLGGTIREKRIFLKMNSSVTRQWGSIRLVFAKASAYVLIFLATSLFSMGILYKWFLFPDNGHFLFILFLLVPYLYGVSFMGLAISMLFKERIQSILFLVFVSPIIVFLSCISWPAISIPKELYFIAHIFPSVYMVPGYLKIREYGANMASVKYEWIALWVQSLIYFGLACFAYKMSMRRFGKRIGEIN